ncbi:hypothetical protein SAMN04488527_10185 [Aliiroseovarius crassostreae]|nr:hypothetical protein SAMN04488527_10185 [Aliiroseovarius crassostreae]
MLDLCGPTPHFASQNEGEVATAGLSLTKNASKRARTGVPLGPHRPLFPL